MTGCFTEIFGEDAIPKFMKGLNNFVRILAFMRVLEITEYAFYYMMDYLTSVWNLSTTHAAGIINIWNGMTSVLMLIFAFCVDVFVGNYSMVLFAATVQSVGLGLLFMSMPPVLSSCNDYKEECVRHTQKVLLYTALPLIALGTAGFAVSLRSFLKSQIEKDVEDMFAGVTCVSILKAVCKAVCCGDRAKNENVHRYECGINWTLIALCVEHVVVVIVIIALSYIKPWSVRFGIPALCTVVATLVFLCGHRGYNKQGPKSKWSSLTTILNVFGECLSVQELKDNKTAILMLSMWLTFIVPGIVLSIGNTYFLEQANHMDRSVGKIKITLPIFLLFYKCTSFFFEYLYRLLPMCLPKKKYAPLVGMAIGMVISVLCCITAAKVETQRLHRIRDHGLLDKPQERIPMTIFILLPQFWLLGAVDGITTSSIKQFFKQEIPEYMPYFSEAVLGLGKMASVLSVYIVGKVSERNHNPNWFQYTISESRLDRYYWVLAMLSAANLVIYVVIVAFTYKSVDDDDDDDDEDDEITAVLNPIKFALSSLFSILH